MRRLGRSSTSTATRSARL